MKTHHFDYVEKMVRDLRATSGTLEKKVLLASIAIATLRLLPLPKIFCYMFTIQCGNIM